MEPHPDILRLDPLQADTFPSGLQTHLGGCADCRRDWEIVREIAEALRPGPADTRKIPAAVEDAISRAVTEAVGRARARRRPILPRPALAAAAAVVLAAALVHHSSTRNDAPQTTPRQAVRRASDIDRNGTVDILDAYAIARGIGSGGAEASWDVNRDGAVDGTDAEQVAREAVSLKEGA